ncbi:MAG: hypothetical protein R3B81_09820 [bacterium]
MSGFKREERDTVVREIYDLRAKLFPPGDEPPDFHELRERYYQRLAEYLDRIPRVPVSVCPFTGQVVKRALDPWGFDGQFWHEALSRRPEEPRTSANFQVLLGAVALRRDAPTECRDAVKPGPDVPFVVPNLLALPGMVAVVSRVRLETGDDAYPIAYFAEDPSLIKPADLHQPWLRPDYWFENDEGDQVWSIANDVWDFDLAPWLDSGQVRWTDLEQASPVVHRLGEGVDCPFLDLPGQRQPQLYADGERSWLPVPNGAVVSPFEERDPEEEDPKALEEFLAADAKAAEKLPSLEELAARAEKNPHLTAEEKEIIRKTLADVARDDS